MRRIRCQPWHFHPHHPDVVVPVHVDPTGARGPTAQMVRGKRWRRLGGGWFVPADVDRTHLQQRVVEAALALPEHGAVTGWADLAWRGARWFDGRARDGTLLPVPLAVAGSNLRPTPGRAPSKERLLPSDIEVVDGLRLTRTVRSVLFEMRYAASVRAAVRVFDTAAYDDLVSLAEARCYLTSYLSGWTGVPRAREALDLVDENAWSPTEVDLRLVWVLDAGLPRPSCNRPIFTLDGRHLATPDLFDSAAGVAGEYDGALHLDGARHVRDLERVGELAHHGIIVVSTVAADRRDPRAFLKRLHTAYERAAARAPGPRSWTTTPPHWWVPTDSVAARRALAPGQRHLLAHRRAA